MKINGSPTAVLRGFLDPLGRSFTTASAREIVAFRPDEAALHHMEELADKCDDGQLTPEDRAEYHLLVDLGDWMTLLQARARQFLMEHPEP